MSKTEHQHSREEGLEQLFNRNNQAADHELRPDNGEKTTELSGRGEEFVNGNLQMGRERDAVNPAGRGSDQVAEQASAVDVADVDLLNRRDPAPHDGDREPDERQEATPVRPEDQARDIVEARAASGFTDAPAYPSIDDARSSDSTGFTVVETADTTEPEGSDPSTAAATEVSDMPNRAPTDIGLSASAVDENSGAGTVVANLSAVDEDTGEAFTFSISDDPDGLFAIEGDHLLLRDGVSLDFESAATHELTIRVTDAGGKVFEKTVSIDVGNVNEGPTDIVVDGGSVDENSGAGTVVANLSAVDEDTGEAFTFSISDDPDGLFAIEGDHLLLRDGVSLDFESAATHELTIRVTDAGGKVFEKTVSIDVGNVNEGPTDIVVDGGSVDENSGAGTVVANLSAVDEDTGEAFTFSISDDPDGLFAIEGDHLLLRDGVSLDFESAATHELTIRVTDAGGKVFEKTVSIDVGNVNEGPTDIVVDGGSVDENSGAGTVVANLSAVDEDTGEAFTYELASDPSGYFDISGSQIVVKAGADINFEASTSHDVEVRVTDSAGNTYTESISLSVGDVNESVPGVTVSGTGGQDHLVGTDGDDNLDGGRGNDTLEGGAGDDTFRVYGDAGTDQIDGGDGFDTLQGTTASDVFRVEDGMANISNVEAIDGGAGYDVIQGGNGNDTIDLSAGPALSNIEEIDGGYGDDHIIGTSGNDFIEGNRGNDTLEGGAGDDTFRVYGDAGTDQIDGGDGFDTLQGTTASDVFRVEDGMANISNVEAIDGGAGYDVIQGGNGNDTIDLSAGPALSNIEEIDGGYGDDHIIGTSGNDFIEGNRGNDTLEGGAGDDTFRVYGDAGTDQIDGGDGFDTLQGTTASDVFRVEDGMANISNVEAIDGGAGYDVIQGGNGNDTIDLSAGPALSNIEEIDGGYGDDHIIGTSGNDFIEGNRGNDTLEGGAGDDTFRVYGDAGTDQIDGGDGFDTLQGTTASDVFRVEDGMANISNVEAIDGGAGYDVIQGGNGNDTIDLSAGPALSNIEEIDGGYGDDHIIGTSGNDFIEGNRGNDTLEGGAGDDTFRVYGDAGTDQIDGGDGFDTLQGTTASDVFRVEDGMANISNVEAIDGGAGYDVIQGGNGNDTIDLSAGPALSNIEEIDGGYGDDHIIGTSGNDFIEGNRGNDTLEGGAGDDTFRVYGDAGTDQIDGGDGFDTLQGTTASDVFRVEDGMANISNVEAIDGGAGYDVIQGGNGNDTIDLSAGPALSNIEEIDGGYGDDHIIGTSGNDFIEGNRGNDTYSFGMDSGHDSFQGGSGWTDEIHLDASNTSDPNNPWIIEINSEVVDYDMASHALDLGPDSAGTITLEDGSQLDFEGIEKIVW